VNSLPAFARRQQNGFASVGRRLWWASSPWPLAVGGTTTASRTLKRQVDRLSLSLSAPKVWEDSNMSRAKKASKRKSRACAVPLLGAAGLSLSMVSSAPAATVGPTAHEITLGEEEISDVSLATFYVFDKENPRTFSPSIRLVGHGHGGGGHGGHGGCGGRGGHGGCHHGGHGHGGCHHGGCGGCHHRGCGGCGGCGGCVGIWWGGCGGCGGCSGGYWCWRNGVRIWCYY
jgi:hypothetical protein